MRSARKAALGLGLVLTLAGSLRTARAQPSANAVEAQRDFEQGVAAFERGDLPLARALFESSTQRLARPSALVNLALSELGLGLPAQAMRTADELDALLATTAYASSRERFAERAMTLRREAEEELRRRAASQQTTVVAAPGTPSRVPPAAVPPRPPTPSKATPRLLAGTAGVLGLAAVGTGAIWWREVEQNMAACHGPDGETCLELSEISRQRQFAMHTTIALGSVTLALSIGSAAWLLHLRRYSEKDAAALGSRGIALLRPVVTPRALGLELRGRF
jgi:hypothetical protein